MQTVNKHDLADSMAKSKPLCLHRCLRSLDSESKRRSLSPRARCLRRRVGSRVGGALLFLTSEHNQQGPPA